MQADSEKVKKRYNRIAPFFDALEGFLEGIAFKQRRKILWSKVKGEDLLEVGVGTGKNFSFYPPDIRVTAVDFSQDMLREARKKRHKNKVSVELVLMDVQSLCYADNSFDTIIASFVFCSVPQPIKGLQELYRVCKPGGQILLLEHVLSSSTIKSAIMNFLNPFVALFFGANINRQTVKNVQACGFEKVLVDPASSDTVKIIQAIKQ
ncbi:MAG: methyltransferase domain-containing protein [Methylococcales bacterium]|nr:methyltransferase domain-containing protein [Methylococcales bacterium]